MKPQAEQFQTGRGGAYRSEAAGRRTGFAYMVRLAVFAVAAAGSGCASHPTREQIGTATGAVVGGVVGSALTGGSTAGTVAGAGAGALVGAEVGRSLGKR
jgi:osmotically inducible lipoprotein OsmB